MSALITGAFLRRVFGASFLISFFILAAYCIRPIYAEMTYVKNTFYADAFLRIFFQPARSAVEERGVKKCQ